MPSGELDDAALARLGDLASGIAFDLNTLISTMVDNAETARRSLAPDSPLEGHLESVREAGHRAAMLVMRLVYYADRGARPPDRLDLAVVVRTSLDVLGAVLPSGVTIEPDLPMAPVPVLADEIQLHLVIHELVANARDSLPPGGGAIAAGVAVEGAEAVLTIRDWGSGMNGNELNYALAPFSTTKGSGRGLGLPTAVAIVRRNGGEFMIESGPGEGTLVQVRFPLAGG